MHNKEYLDELLARYAKEGPAGCACAVAQNGSVTYEGYQGYADREAGRKIDADTVYRLFSMTKLITCAAALILYERGKFLLNEPLYEYIPEYRDINVVKYRDNDGEYVEKAKNPLLIKHAFSMTCGLPYGYGNSMTSRAINEIGRKGQGGQFDVVDHVRALAGVPLAFEPGTHWLYGHGHEIVAALIKILSGMPVGEFMKKEIFDPLGMTSTGYHYFGDIESRMAKCYDRADDGTLTPSDTSDSDMGFSPDCAYEGGGAGLFSTLGDYVKFTQMLANGGMGNGQQILGRKTIDLFRENQLTTDALLRDFQGSYTAGYGYGLGVRTMLNIGQAHANTTPGEFGWTGALGTYTSIDPSEGVSLVYMHQMRPNMEEYHHLRVRAAAYAMLK